MILKIIIRGYVSVKELRMCLLFFLEKLGYLIELFEFMCRYNFIKVYVFVYDKLFEFWIRRINF